uniref:Uncharacterized protein n=1 Tax=Arundo donax TaxID=35708 RepID=A0A0A9HUX1_ARUDO
MEGICKKGFEGLEYYQKTSYGQGYVKINYLRARTITRLSRSYGFHL